MAVQSPLQKIQATLFRPLINADFRGFLLTLDETLLKLSSTSNETGDNMAACWELELSSYYEYLMVELFKRYGADYNILSREPHMKVDITVRPGAATIPLEQQWQEIKNSIRDAFFSVRGTQSYRIIYLKAVRTPRIPDPISETATQQASLNSDSPVHNEPRSARSSATLVLPPMPTCDPPSTSESLYIAPVAQESPRTKKCEKMQQPKQENPRPRKADLARIQEADVVDGPTCQPDGHTSRAQTSRKKSPRPHDGPNEETAVICTYAAAVSSEASPSPGGNEVAKTALNDGDGKKWPNSKLRRAIKENSEIQKGAVEKSDAEAVAATASTASTAPHSPRGRAESKPEEDATDWMAPEADVTEPSNGSTGWTPPAPCRILRNETRKPEQHAFVQNVSSQEEMERKYREKMCHYEERKAIIFSSFGGVDKEPPSGKSKLKAGKRSVEKEDLVNDPHYRRQSPVALKGTFQEAWEPGRAYAAYGGKNDRRSENTGKTDARTTPGTNPKTSPAYSSSSAPKASPNEYALPPPALSKFSSAPSQDHSTASDVVSTVPSVTYPTQWVNVNPNLQPKQGAKGEVVPVMMHHMDQMQFQMHHMPMQQVGMQMYGMDCHPYTYHPQNFQPMGQANFQPTGHTIHQTNATSSLATQSVPSVAPQMMHQYEDDGRYHLQMQDFSGMESMQCHTDDWSRNYRAWTPDGVDPRMPAMEAHPMPNGSVDVSMAASNWQYTWQPQWREYRA